MMSSKIIGQYDVHPKSNAAVAQLPAPTGDNWLRAARAHRARASGPLEPAAQSFGARWSQALLADAFWVAGTCRPTRLAAIGWQAARARLFQPGPPKPQQVCAVAFDDAAQSSAAKLLSTMRRAPSLVGAVIGCVVDAVAVVLALVVAMPGVVLHALWTASMTGSGLKIDVPALPKKDLEAAYNQTVRDNARDMLEKNTNGVSRQLALDLPRQNMFVDFGDGEAPEPLPKDLEAAVSVIRGLCQDEGDVERSWLWAVTDMSTQGLLNALYAELTKKSVMRFDGIDCVPNLNGDTTYTLRRVEAGAVAVRAEVCMPHGLQVLLPEAAQGSPLRHDPTPLRFELEVVVYRGQEDTHLPSVQVRNLSVETY